MELRHSQVPLLLLLHGINSCSNKGYVDSIFLCGSGPWTLSGSNVYVTNTAHNIGIGTTNPQDQLNITGIARIGGTTFPNPDSNSVIRISAQGTAGEHRNYIELQGVYANDATNEGGGGFIKFRTSTSANYGPEIGGIRRSGGTGDFLIKTGGNNPQVRLTILMVATSVSVLPLHHTS